MVIQNVDPAQILANTWPIRGCIYLTTVISSILDFHKQDLQDLLLASIVLYAGAEALRYIDIDEVSKEEHEVSTEARQNLCQVPEARNAQCVVKGVVWKMWKYAT